MPKTTLHPKTAPGGPQADSDFDVEQFTPIGSWGVCPSCSLATLGPNMSVANDGNTYYAVGNFFAALYTTTGGADYFDPNAVAGSVGESFTDGNQQVIFEPSRAAFFWVLQSAAPNYHLVLVSLPDGASGCVYDFTPTSLGLPSGDHLLSPDLEYSSNYLYLSFVLLDSGYNFADVGVARISLSPLQACGSVSPSAVVRSDYASFTLGQGATDTMFWLSNDYLSGPTTGNHVRVFFWAESSGGGAQDYYPSNLHLIEDPDTPTQPWSIHYYLGGGNTSSCQCWGYSMARAWNPDELHWVAAGWLYFGSTPEPYVIVFGRGRDHQAYLRWAKA